MGPGQRSGTGTGLGLNKFTWHINGNNGLLELLFFICRSIGKLCDMDMDNCCSTSRTLDRRGGVEISGDSVKFMGRVIGGDFSARQGGQGLTLKTLIKIVI